jgi:hypothetical protein
VAGKQRLPRRLPLLLAVAGLLVLRAPAFAQTSDDYVGIVEQYAAGDESSALALLAPHGTVYEMRATLTGNSRFANVVGDRVSSDIRRMFEAAAVDYQRVPDIDGAFALAHLHRGWVHYHLHDSRASQELDAALRDATDESVRYQAHLFLGAVAERNQALEAARRQFEAANSLGPFQTSTVALAWVEAALGDTERARAVTAQYAVDKDATTEDPWWSYRIGGFAPGAVTWLRQEARRP